MEPVDTTLSQHLGHQARDDAYHIPRIEAKPSGVSTSPLDEHAEFLLDLTVERPDLTLDEIVAAMARAGIAGEPHRGVAVL